MAQPRTVIENCAIATVDDRDTEYASGHLVIAGSTLERVGPGPAPAGLSDVVRRVDGSGQLATPGLVNAHHHLYQWLTRGWATEDALFPWLTALYPVWARLDETMVRAAARASLATLVRGGVTLAADHHYLHPRGAGDLSGAVIRAARETGVRFTLARGSMDRGASDGGLPPDDAVETTDGALAATEATIDTHHDPAFDAMTRIAVAPSALFTASTRLFREAAELARRKGVRLHTHGSETVEEEGYCRETFGVGPIEYLQSTGWFGDDVWMAHCVHLSDADIAVYARTGTGVAHCPSSNARLAAGVARVPDLLRAGVPVGLGTDGAAANEPGDLRTELRQAMLLSRLGPRGADPLTARQVLRAATRGGAGLLGREGETGSLEPGKLADLALWRTDALAHGTIVDPVTALVFAEPAPVTLSLVGGRPVVEDGRLVTVDEDAVAREVRTESRRLARTAGYA